MTAHELYKKETGKAGIEATGEDETELAIYVEAPTKSYMQWLENNATTKNKEISDTMICLINILKASNTISTTAVLKALYSEFPYLLTQTKQRKEG